MERRVENYIEMALDECCSITEKQPSDRYLALYESFPSVRVRLLFSSVHDALNDSLRLLNSCLPTGEKEGYFWADSSRTLIALIQLCRDMRDNLKGSECSCSIDSKYEKALDLCSMFLSQSRGSTDETFAISVGERYQRYQLKLIGEGSYAKVFKYRDSFYGKQFVVKRAKPELSEKEISRFRQEYEVMHQLSSPYVVEVYRFDNSSFEYVMECMDYTLESYLKSNGNRLSIGARKSLALQFLRGMGYLHSRNVLHRDISPRNALIRCYDDVTVLKLSDFGLAKLEESTLTTSNTEFKGRFNDPALRAQGFATYGMQHEVYAMTLMLYHILTGRTNISAERNAFLREFVERGTDPNVENRYKDVHEIRVALIEVIEGLSSNKN